MAVWRLWWVLWLLPLSGTVYSQATISGRVKDAKTGEPLPGATVMIEGTAKGAACDLEGAYSIQNLAPGQYTLVVSSVSYKKSRQTITIPTDAPPGGVVRAQFNLEDDNVEKEEVVVTEQRRRDTDVSLINELKMAVVVANGISAEQISRSVDRDAAQVIQRIPGITIQDNRFVIIRGLAQRYNQTLINDAIAPSTEVDSRSFSFDLIPSSVLDRMLINKSSTAETPGDFAGGVVRIFTRSAVTEGFTSVSMAGGYRTQTTGRDFVQSVRSPTDILGFDNGTRQMPTTLPDQLIPGRPGYQVGASGFENNFRTTTRRAEPDFGVNVTTGNRAFVGSGNSVLSNLTSVSLGNSYLTIPSNLLERYRYQSDLTRIFDYRDQFHVRENRFGATSNFLLQTSPRTRYEFKNLFNQIGEDETTIRTGTRPVDRPSDEFRSHAFRYVSRTIYSGQVSGQHDLNPEGGVILRWNVGGNYLGRNEPDYRRVRQFRAMDDPSANFELIPAASAGALEETGRFYSKLREYSVSNQVSVEWRAPLVFFDSLVTFKTGYHVDYRDRDFGARFFTYMVPGALDEDRRLFLLNQPIDRLFEPGNVDTRQSGARDGFFLEEGTRPLDQYRGRNVYVAPFGSMTTSLGPLNINAGLRIEYNQQRLDSRISQTEEVRVNNPLIFPLPSLNLGYVLSPQMQVRFSYAFTVNRPEFRELAPFLYYDFAVDANFTGNPNLKTARVHNADVRWEIYPQRGEIISFGVFGKTFRDPIELGVKPVGLSPQYEFINARSAYSLGAEAEIRRSLATITLDRFLQRFSVVANAAVIYSRVDLGAGIANQDRRRPLQGQSPFVINTSLYYTQEETGTQISVVYNVAGRRIFSVGDNFFPTVYELPRHLVDLAISQRLNRILEARLAISDLFNYRFQFYQDFNNSGRIEKSRDQPIFLFRRGTLFTLGLGARI